MSSTLSTWLVPALGDPQAVRGQAAVVIDVLRASTTLITALAHGAKRVHPCVTLEQAQELRTTYPQAIAGGERGGLPIPGFDFGNSPSDYTAERVAGRDLIFTTTNGTRALAAVHEASWIGVGAFVNLSAVVNRLRGFGSILLVCAGTNGRVTREDVLFAGCVIEALQDQERVLDDSSLLAHQAWLGTWQNLSAPQATDTLGNRGPVLPSSAELAQELERTQGGRNLAKLGLGGDLTEVAQIDAFQVVPQWDRLSSTLVLP